MLLVTPIFASLWALMFIKLAFDVIRFRRENKVSLGGGGVEELERAIRAHGIFVEYVPLGLFLIGALKLNEAPLEVVVSLAVSDIPLNLRDFSQLSLTLPLEFVGLS